MIKQLTVLILILAIANPFCCCFTVSSNGAGDVQNQTKSTSSCCHSSPEEGSHSPEPEAPCPEKCPCKQLLVADSHIKGDVLSANANDDHVALAAEVGNLLPATLSLEGHVGVHSGPPPPSLSLYTLYCVYRI